MEDVQRLKAIIDELLKINQQLTLEKSIATADLGAALAKIQWLEDQKQEESKIIVPKE